MPHYGYRCSSCQREFEVLQRMSDPPQSACPDCGAAGTRLFYPAGILFKGSGFYKTDSRSSSAPATTSGGDGATPAPETKKGDKADRTAKTPAGPSPAPPAAPAAPAAPAPTAASAAD